MLCLGQMAPCLCASSQISWPRTNTQVPHPVISVRSLSSPWPQMTTTARSSLCLFAPRGVTCFSLGTRATRMTSGGQQSPRDCENCLQLLMRGPGQNCLSSLLGLMKLEHRPLRWRSPAMSAWKSPGTFIQFYVRDASRLREDSSRGMSSAVVAQQSKWPIVPPPPPPPPPPFLIFQTLNR